MNAYLTGDQIALLKKSFRQLNTHRVATKFYNKLFEQHPGVRPMFPTDTNELSIKLMSVFELVVFSFCEKKHNQFSLQDAVLLPLRSLGRTHDDKGVVQEHYKIANTLLIETMMEEGEFFNEAVKQSWQLALNHLADAMQNVSLDQSLKNEDQPGISIRETFAHIIQNLKKQVSSL